MRRPRKQARQLPILPTRALEVALAADEDEALRNMASDAQLLRRGLEYLEAVGDVLMDTRLPECVLLDPVGWFASFLAHFIRDDGNRPAQVVRGVVSEADIVAALSYEYDHPEEQVPQIMLLVTKQALYFRHHTMATESSGSAAPATIPAFPPLPPSFRHT